MAYLREAEVRRASRADTRVATASAAAVLKEDVTNAAEDATFDVFLCHSVRDAEIVFGATRILRQRGLKVYVDWIVDPQMNRSNVTATTAAILRRRMRQSSSLFYLCSTNSNRSRWMPWEVGFFDGAKGNVAVLPILPDAGDLDFEKEEYLCLYPKVELQQGGLFVNRTKRLPVSGDDRSNYRDLRSWMSSRDKMRPA